jgi:hypothetical protein
MNDLLSSSNDLLGSSEWGRRIEQVNQSADGRMTVALAQSQVVVNDIFRRVYLALGVLFVMLIVYRWISFHFARRLKFLAASASGATSGNGRTTRAAGTGLLPSSSVEKLPRG